MEWGKGVPMPPRTVILLIPLLLADGPAPRPCGQAQAVDPRQAEPTDLLGRPVPATPLVSSALGVIPAPEGVEACAAVRRRNDASPDAKADALHGLPPPDLTQVVPVQTGH
jgi:hypothetical protein